MKKPINYTRCLIECGNQYHFGLYEKGIDSFRLPDQTLIKYCNVSFWIPSDNFNYLMDNLKSIQITLAENDLKQMEETMKDNYCMACGYLQQYCGDGDFVCERCGANNGKDGCSYDGSRVGQENMDYKINEFNRKYVDEF